MMLMMDSVRVKNLYQNGDAIGETIEELLSGDGVRLEHIVSRGETSPDDFWYDPSQDEWVVLMKGTATLEFQDVKLKLIEGDSLMIQAGEKHRVDKVSQDAVWIALHGDF